MALGALRDLLVSPRTFFEERPPGDLTAHALGAVLLTALVTLVGVWALFRVPLAEMPPEGRRAFRRLFGAMLVLVPLVTLVGWGIVTGVVHLAVRNYAERATFGRTFAVVGLAALVEIPVMLLGFAEAYYLFQSVSFAEPRQAVAQLQSASGGDSPLAILAWAVVTLWKGYIWREGLLGAYDLPADRATLAAAVGAGLAFIFVVVG